jgi:hypothetical protein
MTIASARMTNILQPECVAGVVAFDGMASRVASMSGDVKLAGALRRHATRRVWAGACQSTINVSVTLCVMPGPAAVMIGL